ncbi:H-type small acid-soluble spore protein [Haloimpatiens sp. FM7330]|uniref:H-type small acid-soluble spore protein n=1 Tax=Haloimpatiens sp. FM7330 TaxID=3298610 RepID=UPI00363EE104
MNLKRGEEIINSLGVINVTYKDKPVWIENINEERKIAKVKYINSTESISVPISQLNEDKK